MTIIARTTFLRTAAIAVAMALAGAALTPAAAQDVPRSGTFSQTWALFNPTPFAPIDRGDGTNALVSAWIGSLVSNDGGPFMTRMTGQCVTYAIRVGTTTQSLEGHCVYVDADGDRAYEDYYIRPDSGGFRGVWSGGTGKYAGLTGEFTINSLGVVPAGAYTTTIGTHIGTYRLP